MNTMLWVISPPHPQAEVLAADLGIPREIAQVLANRNILDRETAQKFLGEGLEGLHDPYLMAGMEEAVARIQRAVSSGEKILIFGDYDVDGVLSVVMLHKALSSLGAKVDYFIPGRLKEGYGIKEHHISVPEERGAGLVISVDCGIKALDFAAAARRKGIDVIITDHHTPGQVLPEAVSILNPALNGSEYPYRGLAGVGVVFKLVQALLAKAGKNALLPHYMKLVCIGTVADVAELKGENRLFVRHGLKSLESVSNTGLKSLIEACGLKNRRISEGDLGFRIGPRINAAGRMGMTDVAVRLFFSDSLEESRALVKKLEELNSQRQWTEENIFEQAKSKIEDGKLAEKYKCLILGDRNWHRGVIGIVASKLKDYFHRPVILFSYENGQAFGSGRSISECDLISLIEDCRDFFLSYGGHRLAVGCSLKVDDIPGFRTAMNDLAAKRIVDDVLKKKIRIDSALAFEALNVSFLDYYRKLLPFGVGNPKPVFLSEKVRLKSDIKSIQGKHVKFWGEQSGRMFEVIGWDKADWTGLLQREDQIDIVYSLFISEYGGEEKVALSAEDFRR